MRGGGDGVGREGYGGKRMTMMATRMVRKKGGEEDEDEEEDAREKENEQEDAHDKRSDLSLYRKRGSGS
eukprot:7836543-Pyramimonas_sp.AAC.1